ncbi:hypothetical protein PRZ48_002122 [Zasmidium cellare]|uniref:Uncharacterized protein n=1 Tax=Zasmidium cellare TaxID=395010 RepID=A0ABR0F358_ZASCE|nr:hypothetical protein PRZ48_002122 [Zasmidium cellare]
MAKIFKLCAEYERTAQHTGWSSLLRRFTRKPTWKKVSKYDNILNNVGKIGARKGSSQVGRKPVGICKMTATTPTRRSTSPVANSPKRTWYSSLSRKRDDNMDALVHLLSGDFLREINFVLRGGEILLEKRRQCSQMRNEGQNLRALADKIQSALIAAQLQQDMAALSSADRDRQQVDDLREQAEAIVIHHNRLNDEIAHGMRVLMLAWDDIKKGAGPRLEQARLLEAVDETAIRARLLASLPDNDVFPPEHKSYNPTAPTAAASKSAQETSAEQQGKEAIRKARLRAVDVYNEAHTVVRLHHEKYKEQLNNHLKGINPGWPSWEARWTQADFDRHHLWLAMQHSKAVREAEEAFFKTIDDAYLAGVEPMQPFQIYGYHDDPGDNPADSVRGGVPSVRIHAWREMLPRSPPNPEPWGPGVVRYPSEQMSDLEGDVEAWETWSHREEDMQKTRLLEKYRGPRPLGWTLPAEKGSANGGDGGRLMNSHLI